MPTEDILRAFFGGAGLVLLVPLLVDCAVALGIISALNCRSSSRKRSTIPWKTFKLFENTEIRSRHNEIPET